jgi:hypothetical protein
MAPNMGIRSHGRIATAQTSLFDESQRGEAIDGAFGSDAQGSHLKPGWDSHLSGADATFGRTPVFSGDSQMALAGKWSGSGYKAESGSYVSSSSNDAAVSRTMSLLCANYSLCIEYDPAANRFTGWQGGASPADGSYASAKPFGWTSGGALLGNAGSAVPATNDAGDLIPTMLSTVDSNAVTFDSGSASPGVVTQSALTGGNNGILSVAANISRALTSSLASDESSDQTDPLHLGGGSEAPRVTPPVIQHGAASGSSSTPIVDSELQAAGDQVINQSASSVDGGSIVDGAGSNSWAPELHDPGPVSQFSVTSISDPPSTPTGPGIDPASPVPEPSQFVLMFTVIALTALAAKRSAFKRRAAARPGV